MLLNIGWGAIGKHKDLFLFRVHAVWILVVPILSRILDAFNVNVFHISTCPPSLWLILYFASLFILGARVIYETMCPQLIKDYRSFAEFRLQKMGAYYVRKQLYCYLDKDDVDTEWNRVFDSSASPFKSFPKEQLEEYFCCWSLIKTMDF